jgi:hypothetical protein
MWVTYAPSLWDIAMFGTPERCTPMFMLTSQHILQFWLLSMFRAVMVSFVETIFNIQLMIFLLDCDLCSFSEISQCFKISWFPDSVSTLKKEAVCSSEIFVAKYNAGRCYNPEIRCLTVVRTWKLTLLLRTEFRLTLSHQCTLQHQETILQRCITGNDRLCGLVVRVPGYRTEMYCVSCEVRIEFYVIYSRKLDRLCGLVVRVPGYRTEMYCVSCEVRTEFMYDI